jgi:hypothetical protein
VGFGVLREMHSKKCRRIDTIPTKVVADDCARGYLSQDIVFPTVHH